MTTGYSISGESRWQRHAVSMTTEPTLREQIEDILRQWSHHDAICDAILAIPELQQIAAFIDAEPKWGLILDIYETHASGVITGHDALLVRIKAAGETT